MRRVRLAQPSDVKVCAVILREWLESAEEMAVGQQIDSNFDYEADLRRVLGSEDSRIFVYEDDQGVQGFIAGSAHDKAKPDLVSRAAALARRLLRHGSSGMRVVRAVGTIDQVVVRPGKRNNYMSLALMKELIKWFKSRGLTAVEAAVWSANTRTLRVSERVGFKPVRVLIRKELE